MNSLGDREIINATIKSPAELKYVFSAFPSGDQRVQYLKDVAAVKALNLGENVEEKIMLSQSSLPKEFKISEAQANLQKYIASDPDLVAIRKADLSVYEEMLPGIVKALQNKVFHDAYNTPIVAKYAAIIEKANALGNRTSASNINITCDRLLKHHGFDLEHLSLPNSEDKTVLEVARASELKERGYIIKEIKRRLKMQNGNKSPGLKA